MKFRQVILGIIQIVSNVAYKWVQLRNSVNPDSKIRVLVYHQVHPVNKSGTVQNHWCVSAKSFSDQMKLLSSGGYNVLSVSEVLRHLQTRTPFPTKAVCVTFDDGYRDNYQYAFPALVQYGIMATFYVTTKYLGTDRPFDWIKPSDDAQNVLYRKPLNWQEITMMKDHGMEFASHSHTHPNFFKINVDSIKWELLESRRLLSEHLDLIGNSFVCPYGIWGKSSGALKELLQHNGYSGAFLGKWGSITLKTDRFDLPRIIIYGEDSIKTFRYKIEGAYDWVGFFHSCYHYLRTFINRRRKKNA